MLHVRLFTERIRNYSDTVSKRYNLHFKETSRKLIMNIPGIEETSTYVVIKTTNMKTRLHTRIFNRQTAQSLAENVRSSAC